MFLTSLWNRHQTPSNQLVTTNAKDLFYQWSIHIPLSLTIKYHKYVKRTILIFSENLLFYEQHFILEKENVTFFKLVWFYEKSNQTKTTKYLTRKDNSGQFYIWAVSDIFRDIRLLTSNHELLNIEFTMLW